MKFLCSILVGLVISVTAQAGWVTGSVHVRDDNSKTPIALFVNSYTGVGPVANQWHQIDVTTFDVPATAKSVFLSGLLIITHGTSIATCDLTFSSRAPGDSLLAGNYITQTIEASTGNGQRSAMAIWTPVKDGKIEIYWGRNTGGQYPTDCAYGINLSAQAYIE